ncbi:MAG: porin [Elusimicrobia bacterium]|nr:MAG: porin [Elusimicrobiota bacterium]
MVYMGGPLSGAHYNPAVSAAVTLRGKMGPEMIFYMAVQTLAAFAACLTVFMLEGEFTGIIIAPGVGSAMGTLFKETLLTFVLCFVILNVATSKATEGNQYFGLAIGATLAAIAHIGMCFNPAIAIASAVVDLFQGAQAISSVWIFIVGPMMGGALAAFAYALINPSEVGA